MIDPFAADGFTLISMTRAIRKLPNRYGRLAELGLFRSVGLTTRTVEIEEKNGVLTLVPTMPWGSPGTQNISGKRKLRSFAIPHTPMEDQILAASVQGVRAFDTEDSTTPVTTRVMEKLQEIKDKIDQTMEWRQMGALKGIILDADGSSVLYNLYTEFSISQKTVDFDLDTATTDVRAKCMEVVRHIEDNLFGERMTGVRALCSPEFFDALTGHANVKNVFMNWQAAQEKVGGDVRKGFTFGGITFEEYRASTSNTGGTVSKYIDVKDAHFYPEGTAATFEDYAAPADFNETVNTIGVPYYAKMAEIEFQRGYKVHAQSNRLPMCRRPEILVRGYTG
jgi:hypothetical protein